MSIQRVMYTIISSHSLEKVREGSYLPPRGLDDGATCLQRGHDASLGDGDAPLLHGLVDAGRVLVVHLGVCTN